MWNRGNSYTGYLDDRSIYDNGRQRSRSECELHGHLHRRNRNVDVAVGASVPAPGGVVLSWVADAAYATQPAPITPLAGPINLIGVTSTFGAILVVSETHYVSTFAAPVVTCGANLAALTAATQGNIAGPSAALGQTQVYYNVAAAATAVGFAPSACTITVTDNQPTPSTGTIGVSLTTTGGGIN